MIKKALFWVLGTLCIFFIVIFLFKLTGESTDKEYIDRLYDQSLQGICLTRILERTAPIEFVNTSNKSGNYNKSVKMLLVYIPTISKCNEKSFVSVENYQYESVLYQKLAETLKLKGDLKRAELALVRSKHIQEKIKKFSNNDKKQTEDIQYTENQINIELDRILR